MKEFECDKRSKRIVARTLEKLYNASGSKLIVDLQEDNPTAGIDIYMTAITKGNISTAAIEVKERPNSASTDEETWIVEEGKERKLRAAQEQGYTPLYCYLFGDGVMAIWNINTWDKQYIGEFWVKPHTVLDEPRRKMTKYGVTLNTAKVYKV